MELLKIQNVKKVYTTKLGLVQCVALKNVSFTVSEGEFVAIMGASGSGKTTLLNILASLDKPTSGDVLLGGRSFASVPDRELSRFRRDNMGFVFQDFNLLDTFTLKDNILLPLVLSQTPVKEMESRLLPIAQMLGIDMLLGKYPYACYKRPIPIEKIEMTMDSIEGDIFDSADREIASTRIGEIVMEHLKDLDAVAYVRFASVYREFKDVSTFMDELKKFMEP